MIPKVADPRFMTVVQNENVNGCYLDANQQLFCWGMDIEDLGSNSYYDIGVGEASICVLDDVGQVYCTTELDQGLPNIPLTVLDVGRTHACGIATDQNTYCWGENSEGQTDVPMGIAFVDVSLGDNHSCGLQQDGNVSCWGSKNSLDNIMFLQVLLKQLPVERTMFAL